MFKIKRKTPNEAKSLAFQLKFPSLQKRLRFKYFAFLGSYFLLKVINFGKFFVSLVRLIFSFFQGLKGYIVTKLLWSRGRLGRPAANLAIMFVALVVFLTGGVFSSSGFVTSATISPDYLSNVDDVIPESTVATTSLPEGRRSEAIAHEVRGGETLSSIGELYKVTVDALRYVNNLSDEDFLKVGQKIIVPPVQGIIYKVKAGDTCASIGKKFDVAAQAILDFNYLESCTVLAVGKELVLPDARIPEPAPVIVLPSGPVSYERFVDTNPRSGWCLWPTSVRIITQRFAYYHDGVDIATPWSLRPPIYACAEGTVIRSGWDPQGLGLHVVIDHGNGYETSYGHMSQINVSYGEDVGRGEVIGIMGSTGRSSGPHLHFRLRYRGTPQNPLNYIR